MAFKILGGQTCRTLYRVAAVSLVALSLFGCRLLTSQPEGAVYLRAIDPAQPVLYASAGDYSVNPLWLLTQWNSPSALAATQTVPPGTNWQIANSYSRLKYFASNGTYEVGTNNLSGDVDCSLELSNFLQPVNNLYPAYTQGFSQSSPLDEVEILLVSLNLAHTYAETNSRCPSVNYATTLLGLVFNNHVSGQTLFYQVKYFDTRGVMPNGQWCPVANLLNPAWFCVGDHIFATYGKAETPVGGGTASYDLDVINRVKTLIQSGQTNNQGTPIDGDLSRWELNNLYIGNLTHGGGNITSQWSELCLAEKRFDEEATNECP